MEFRNAQWAADGSINCEINHPVHGWIPYTCRKHTGEDTMQAIWDIIIESGEIAEYVAPTDEEERENWRMNTSLTRMEFILACKRANILTTAESIEAAKGNWPDSFADALSNSDVSIDPDEAQIVWAAASRVERNHPLIIAIQKHQQMTDKQVDTLFGYDE